MANYRSRYSRQRYSSFKPRSVRHLEKRSKRNLYLSFGLAILMVVIFFRFIFPFVLGKASSLNKKSGNTPQNIVNTTKLAPPVFNVPYEATNTATIRVSGYAQPNLKVTVYLNNDLKDTVNVSSDGSFQTDPLDLTPGQNYLFGETVDDKGSKSLDSKAIGINFSNQKPKLDLSSPDDNKVIQGGDKKVTFSGSTDPGDSVSINGNLVIINSDGSFATDQALNDGDNQFSVTATDSIGNTNTVTRKITYKS